MAKLGPQPMQDAKDNTHPILGGGLGDYACQLLSDPGGLTQFGCSIKVLSPGAQSSLRHWHEAEDEMVGMLSGEVVLVEDTETLLQAEDVACWPTGQAVANEASRNTLRAQTGTNYIRLVEPANRLDMDLISGSYVSHIIVGGQRAVAPCRSIKVLRLVGSRWRAASVTNGLANSRWPLIRLELPTDPEPTPEGPK